MYMVWLQIKITLTVYFTKYFKTEGNISERESSLEPPVVKSSNGVGSSYYLNPDLVCEEIAAKNNYILNIAGFFRDSGAKLACSTSNQQILIYGLDRDNLEKVSGFTAHDSTITNTRFGRDKDSHVYTSSLDGTVKLWDLRNSSHLAQTFSGGDSVRPITCFDISCDGRFICAGTEVIGGSAFLLFWDVRSTKLLGGYWESHVDDLTQVVFHPEKKSCMITGGMDGLINIFDIKKPCEDDALDDSLNTELSVDKLGWLHESDSLYCITHSADLQFWKLTDSSPSIHFTRQQMAAMLNIKHPDNLYVVDVHADNEGNNMLLAGSNLGCGDCLRSVMVNKSLNSARSFIGNKQIVRDSVYNAQNNVLITGGEKGVVNVWKAGKDLNHDMSSSKLKGNPHKNKSQRVKPY
ncbi:WD repeat-containing protein 89 isoform X2 [Lycorma delicatula]|uniref:WD repeat-containing protein 89 isoform X2 n=1 Tax=Lycorma delicatula TaxID=130591 RepID=UPI003F511414